MNMNELAVEVSKREGGKVNLPIAQIKEVLAHLSDIVYENGDEIEDLLFENGARRRKKSING